MLISGSCQCKNISFTLNWSPEPTEIPARACTCSFCVKHGGVWTSCADGALEVRVKNPVQVSNYAFGTKTATFHICAVCGVVPVVTSRIDGQLYAVVSVNAFEGVPDGLLKPMSVTFDGENEPARLARRQKGWIARVTIAEGVA
jgi:hypothetical protein